MNVLVVGGGGREHAIVKKLRENPSVEQIFCCPGNGGIAADAVCAPVGATDIEGMVAYAKEHAVDFAVVAPDDPLVLGMADALREAGIATFGPSKAAAAIEGSKVFAKNLMKKYSIPTARYEVFDNPAAAMAYIEGNDVFPVVIKADGLALGKGVLICEDLPAARDAVHAMMEEKVFGQSGSRVVVEEFLTGPEVSVLAFTDSHVVRPMVSSMDHKRALDGDRGLNTGGMGTIAPNPYYTPEVAKECEQTIFLPTIEAMNREGCPFKGCLYFGLMLTPKGPRVIEYNCRFGDPETQVVLPLLQSDLLEIFQAVEEERLAAQEIRWRGGAAACVMVASGGYPQAYEKGKPIEGLNKDGQLGDGVCVYHSGTVRGAGGYATSGGRVLGISATGGRLEEALQKAYAGVKQLRFEGMHYRTDIGRRALQAAEEER